MQSPTENPVIFSCGGDLLMGMLHQSAATRDLAFVFVVGGPQYRVGSHRMFVQLARSLASAGFPCLRFDCRGMGDSDGSFISFEHLEDDIRSAVDCVVERTAASRVILLGLCDGATAAAMYRDLRICGLVLLNPWLRTEASEAKARIHHYYVARLLQREFWRRLIGGEIRVRDSLSSFVEQFRLANRGTVAAASFIDRMRCAMASFPGRILCLLSERDLVAQEFSMLAKSSAAWISLMDQPNVECMTLSDADHTLSGAGQMGAAADAVIGWSQDYVPR